MKLLSFFPLYSEKNSLLFLIVNAAQENSYQVMDFYMIHKVRTMLTEDTCGRGLGSAGRRSGKV